MHGSTNKSMAASVTLHCLTGCAIGEITGLVIGIAFGLGLVLTTGLAVGLAFLFGYTLSLFPLVKHGMAFSSAATLVIAADTLSIATMEIVDNAVMLLVPGAMDSLISPLFWLVLIVALTAAFFAAWPVNYFLLKRKKGHALLMEHHQHH